MKTSTLFFLITLFISVCSVAEGIPESLELRILQEHSADAVYCVVYVSDGDPTNNLYTKCDSKDGLLVLGLSKEKAVGGLIRNGFDLKNCETVVVNGRLLKLCHLQRRI